MKKKALCLLFILLSFNSLSFCCDINSYLRILAEKKRERERLPVKLESNDIFVLHSEGLAMSMATVARKFSRRNKGYRVFLNSSSAPNAAAAMKATSHTPDIIAWSDADPIREMIPEQADWYINFAIDEMILVHGGESKQYEFIKSASWQKMVTSPFLSFGRVDPSKDSAGGCTITVQKLIEQELNIQSANQTAIQSTTVFDNSTELVKAIIDLKVDYGFMYNSEAIYQKMYLKKLPPEVNLGSVKHSDRYAKVGGKAIVYAFTILNSSKERKAARKLADFLISRRGQALFRAEGLKTIPGGQIVFSRGR